MEKALQQLTTTLVLMHPEPLKPFVVEVEVSETWVVVLLSQQFEEKPKLHSIAFLEKTIPGRTEIMTLGTESYLQ